TNIAPLWGADFASPTSYKHCTPPGCRLCVAPHPTNIAPSRVPALLRRTNQTQTLGVVKILKRCLQSLLESCRNSAHYFGVIRRHFAAEMLEQPETRSPLLSLRSGVRQHRFDPRGAEHQGNFL